MSGNVFDSQHLSTHLGQAQEIANVGSWQLDVQSGDLYWSEECFRIFGLDPTEPMSYQRFLATVHPEDRASVQAEWEAALDGADYEIEHRIRVDGETRWVREKADVRFENGEPATALGVVQDITDRKERERALEREHHRYVTLFENLPNPVLYAEVQQGKAIVRTVNPAFEETFGHEEAELAGEPLHDFILPEGAEAAGRELNQLVLEEGSVQTEVTRETPDGLRTFRLQVTTREVEERTVGYAVYTDLSEQKEHQEALEATQKRYRTLIEAAPDPIFVADARSGEIIEANEAAAEFRNQPKADLVGIHQSALHPEGEEAIYRELFEEHIEEEGSRRTLPDGSQIYATTGDGDQIPVEINASSIELPQGPVIYGIFRDISDQLEREKELRVFRRAVENAGHSIYWTDRTGTIEYVNPAFEEITGYDRAEAIGRNPRFLKSGEMPETFYIDLWTTILSGETFQSEVVNETKDGEPFVIDQTISPIEGENGDVERFVAVNSDITDRKQYERELERYETIVESTNDLFFALDENLEVTFANDQFESMLDIAREDLIGSQGTALVDDLTEDEVVRERFTDGATRLRSGVEDEVELELPVNRYGFGTYWVKMTALEHDDENRIVGVARDVTERQDLRQRLSVVNRILRHDIRSAVNIIKGNAELARKTDGASAGSLETVIEEAQRLLDISEDARQIEEILASQGPPREVVDVSALLERKVAEMQAEAPSAVVETSIPDGIHATAAVGIEDAIDHVLSNAVEHNDGPVPEVDVSLQELEEYVEVVVADDGPGIPEDELAPLRQGIETALEHTSGLGLWVVYWLLEHSDGNVSFEVGEAGGTTVRMELPTPGPP